MKKKEAKFPWHASMSQTLELELNVEPDLLAFYIEAFSVHSPAEPPTTLTGDIFEISGGTHLEVLIKPSVIRSDENLKTLLPSERKCFFEGEQKLPFFKTYSRKNCETSQYSSSFSEVCECVPFDFPRNSNTKVCGISDQDFNCFFMFESSFKDSRPEDHLGFLENTCLSPCNSVSYEIEIRESKLRGHEWVCFN